MNPMILIFLALIMIVAAVQLARVLRGDSGNE